MARQFLNITYPSPDHPDYKRVIELAKKANTYKSEVGRRLVHRGLEHPGNPRSLFEDTEATSPVEKIKTVIKEVPVEVIKEVPVYKSPPKVDKSIQEPVAMEDRITDAGPPNKEVLEAKKSPEDDSSGEEKKGIGGWIALGGFLTVIFAPMVYRWCTRKQTEPVNQIGKPNELAGQVDENQRGLPRPNPYNPYI